MNLNQLQYFVILAEEEHYTRAAQMLSITQPSLSHAIALLERELDTRLFEKRGRNVVLTRYGKEFLPYARESLLTLAGGVQRVRALNGNREGEIHLAYMYTLGSSFAPRLVRGFLESYPEYDIKFHFKVGATKEMIEELKNDRHDVVFSSYVEKEGEVEFHKIGNQKLVVVVPSGHALAVKESVALKDTIAYPYIYFTKSSGLRPIIDGLFEKVNAYPDIAFEMEEDGSMAGLVAQNFGIAVMPDIPILRTLPVKRLSIESPEYERAVCMATLKNHYLSPVAKAFVNYVKEETI